MRRRLLGRRAKLVIGSTILAAALGLAILGPWLAPHDPIQQNLMIRLRPPFWGERTVQGYWLGTDNYGRDILSRLILGTRFSILVGISAMLIAGAIGSTLGLVAGYFGGRWEQVIMRFADAYQALPDILLAIVIVAVFGGGLFNLVIVLGVSGWSVYVRIVFGLVRSWRERPFIEAAVASGAGDVYIMARHILPQIVPVLVVVSTLQVAHMILAESALSFLGLGLPPPTPTWGNMLAEGRDRLLVAPWIANLSGLFIILVVSGINFFGNGLREYLDPKARNGR
ncbi:MAG: ABC transporter permease [Alphaproteobacteria bacterium]|nr:ABC transporter permease [Alphaproteobacteria bacterium]